MSNVATRPLAESEAAPGHGTDVSLIVPVFNESRHLERWCEAMLALDLGMSREIIFVDDGSTDGSLAILRRFVGAPGVTLIERARNGGKGAALADGIARARGRVVLVQDADFEYDVSAIPRIVRPILEDQADVVYGSRYLEAGNRHRSFHRFANFVLTVFSNALTGLRFTDVHTCYKAFRRDIVQNIRLTSPRFGFCPEVTARVADLSVRMTEVPVRYNPRTAAEGKKIRWTDGVAAIWFNLRYNLDLVGSRRALAAIPTRYRR